jgi:hypothetical protein
MFGVRKGMVLIAGAAGAGVLIWLAGRETGNTIDTAGDYWGAVGALALAGLALASLQFLARVGRGSAPALSPTAILLGFVPALIVAGFVILFAQPAGGWLAGDTRSFAADIGVDGVAADMAQLWPVLPFLLGVLLGLTLDAVPRPAPATRQPPVPVAAGGDGRPRQPVRQPAPRRAPERVGTRG